MKPYSNRTEQELALDKEQLRQEIAYLGVKIEEATRVLMEKQGEAQKLEDLTHQIESAQKQK